MSVAPLPKFFLSEPTMKNEHITDECGTRLKLFLKKYLLGKLRMKTCLNIYWQCNKGIRNFEK